MEERIRELERIVRTQQAMLLVADQRIMKLVDDLKRKDDELNEYRARITKTG